MRVIRNEKFTPLSNEQDGIYEYVSVISVEVSGQVFTVSRSMTPAEFDGTYPTLRDFIHNALRSAIMVDIRKKLFEGVPT